MSGFRCQFCKGSLTKVHYPKLYNMAHLLSLNVFTASKGSNNYILFELMTISDTNPAVEPQDMLRGLVFWTWEKTKCFFFFVVVVFSQYISNEIILKWV